MSKLFTPFKIKDITMRNKIVMSPMCQFSAKDGVPNDWHLVHYGSRAIGGCGAIIVEAAAVSPEGRITCGDLGLWNEHQTDAFAKIISFMEEHEAVPGIQLAHAGRKGSFDIPWDGEVQLNEGPDSWQTVAPSPIAFKPNEKTPIELTQNAIREVITDFKQAAQRAIKAGFKILEIHAAHGYLIHQFLSPLSNKRQDSYGGSFENRIRLLLNIVDEIKTLIDSNHSLWVRISATDWVEGGWTDADSVKLATLLKAHGVEVIDVSTGGNVPHASIPVGINYQVPFAEKIKKESGIAVGAVGLIKTADQAEKLLQENKCDLIILGRELLKDPYFPVNAALALDEPLKPVKQYTRGY